jgi:hypothetical protein
MSNTETERLIEREIRNEDVPFWQSIKIEDIDINIYSELKHNVYETYGIPSASFNQEESPETPYSVIHYDSNYVYVDCNEDKNTFILFCPKEEISNAKPLIYLANSLAERERQLEGRLLTHGAGVVSPDNKGVVILGNQGSGKTTLAINMGLRGYSLMGNDQIIIGQNPEKNDRKQYLLGGTKYLTIRKAATLLGHIPLDINFTKDDVSPWENKKVILPEEFGIEVREAPAEIKAVIITHIDALKQEETRITKLSPTNIKANLFLGEKFARHISGVATHLLSDSGYLLSHLPSLDDRFTRANRLDLIRGLYDTGIYTIHGGDVEEMINRINHVIAQ